MPDVFSNHEPLLVNTLGHCAGTLVFGIFLFLLLRDRAGTRLRGNRLTILAAALALIWNFASLLVIAVGNGAGATSQWLVALSSSALSLLPAVLLHLSLGGRFPWIRWTGFALSLATVGIHVSEILRNSPEDHQLALRITSYGFGALTLVAVAGLLSKVGDRGRLTPRLVGTMSLFLFALSFVHLGGAHTHSWAGELIAHHAGIALALFVLLQDYRFVLLDAFLRFLANILLAALFVFAMFAIADPREVLRYVEQNPFREGMALVGGCLLLLLFAYLRSQVSRLLSSLVFRRQDMESLLLELRSVNSRKLSEAEFLQTTAALVAGFFHAPLIQLERSNGRGFPILAGDLPAAERDVLEARGVGAILPVRVAAEDVRNLLLGRRDGGRRYLSEDLAAMRRIQAELTGLLDQRREEEMRRLVSQAELRALQAQINPHFLFNALNALYGIIPREAQGARKMVLNLADIFRYFLQSERTLIPLDQELAIVRAYLEIESLRLGSKLKTRIEASPEARRIPIPILTVQPLVENAVKHGVARRAEGGEVQVLAAVTDEGMRIRILDTGVGFGTPGEGGAGVGLENVGKRLKLCFGPEAELQVKSSAEGTEVGFLIPVAKTELAAQ